MIVNDRPLLENAKISEIAHDKNKELNDKLDKLLLIISRSLSNAFLVKLVVRCDPLERVTARLLTLFAMSDSVLILALADLGLRVS